jgi:hypothetical protein
METITPYLAYWPFIAVLATFSVVWQFMSKNLFTRERAYGHLSQNWFVRNFWWWGRETLKIQPILAGALLGALWQSPQGIESGPQGLVPSAAYFATAGAFSLFGWMWLKSRAKIRGIILQMPGDSDPPAKPEA